MRVAFGHSRWRPPFCCYRRAACHGPRAKDFKSVARRAGNIDVFYSYALFSEIKSQPSGPPCLFRAADG